MINPQELRIGNYISNKKDILFNVLPEDIETISKFPDNYNPIPLTEEFMFKSPFLIGTGKLYYELGDIRLDSVFDPNAPTDLVLIYGRKTIIRYIHTLQNLVFALEGVELVTL